MLYTDKDRERRAPVDRKVSEAYRTDWSRDQSRLLHSPSFRRLAGKTQLFPAGENDFFRNRLTHSLEVSKIARTIACRLNYEQEAFSTDPLNLDLIDFACMAHDLGHPLFGHIGERALNGLMKDAGGFEGNAQTFRILSRLEKRERIEIEGRDGRCGLNLTARAMAATIKKHHVVRPNSEKIAQGKVDKGVYEADEEAYNFVLDKTYEECRDSVGITIESSIMDISDDIAYATYDFEDILKSGFFSPIDMVSLSPDRTEEVCKRVTKGIKDWYPGADEFTNEDYAAVVRDILNNPFFEMPEEYIRPFKEEASNEQIFANALALAGFLNDASENVARKTANRINLTSGLVELFVNNVEWNPSETGKTKLSTVRMPIEVLRMVETLKHLAFVLVVKSPNISISEQRGTFIVKSLWRNLYEGNLGVEMMPEDVRYVFQEARTDAEKARAVCDFIAGMTDQYALALHSRMIGATTTSVHVPV
ncbi:deoxyguanosinetriphosphate triphosphohydrolase family protein [Brevundimonas sp. NPDC092305]|uniref:deoxyguanosinetriphosphate triphosphohydrolase family protein n=1 Tax=Brevundimonas sp. NPDC092305 TaxID=3363957 RepID=UPI0037F833EE